MVNRKRDLQQLCWDRDEKIRIVQVENLCRKPGKGHEDLSTLIKLVTPKYLKLCHLRGLVGRVSVAKLSPCLGEARERISRTEGASDIGDGAVDGRRGKQGTGAFCVMIMPLDAFMDKGCFQAQRSNDRVFGGNATGGRQLVD